MNQPDLAEVWSKPAARRSDPETSRAAAADASMRASEGRLLVLVNLNRRDLSDFGLASATGWKATSIGKRRLECQRAGLVENALDGRGEFAKDKSDTGSACLIWAITAKGRAFLEELGVQFSNDL